MCSEMSQYMPSSAVISEAVPSAEGRATQAGRPPMRPACCDGALEQLRAAGAVAEAEREQEGGGDERAGRGDDDLARWRRRRPGLACAKMRAICVMLLCITE